MQRRHRVCVEIHDGYECNGKIWCAQKHCSEERAAMATAAEWWPNQQQNEVGAAGEEISQEREPSRKSSRPSSEPAPQLRRESKPVNALLQRPLTVSEVPKLKLLSRTDAITGELSSLKIVHKKVQKPRSKHESTGPFAQPLTKQVSSALALTSTLMQCVLELTPRPRSSVQG
jgi:hypothetical protein